MPSDRTIDRRGLAERSPIEKLAHPTAAELADRIEAWLAGSCLRPGDPLPPRLAICVGEMMAQHIPLILAALRVPDDAGRDRGEDVGAPLTGPGSCLGPGPAAPVLPDGDPSREPALDWTISEETKAYLREIAAATVRPGDPRMNMMVGPGCHPPASADGSPEGQDAQRLDRNDDSPAIAAGTPSPSPDTRLPDGARHDD